MEIFVCLRQTPIIKGEPKIQMDRKSLDLSGLNRHMNEWDTYALEEALQMVQKHGGNVTVVSLGPKETEDVLLHGLAAGAAKAIHIVTSDQQNIDNWMISNVLNHFINKQPFDLILTGVQAEDDGCAEIGPTLAYLLEIPHGSMVVRTEYEPDQNEMKVIRELEGGYKDSLRLKLPALLTVQTGINQPRYVSTMRLRRFKKEATITKLSFSDIASEIKALSPRVEILEFFPYKPEASQVEWLEGEPMAVADELFERLRAKGVL